jgi:putative AlgH/UPF0301 family transcriptional regulator
MTLSETKRHTMACTAQRIYKRSRLDRELKKIKNRDFHSLPLFPEQSNNENSPEVAEKAHDLNSNASKLTKVLPIVVQYINSFHDFMKLRYLSKRVYISTFNNFYWGILLANVEPRLIQFANPKCIEPSLKYAIIVIREYSEEASLKMDALKGEGNALYASNDYNGALQSYFNNLMIIRDIQGLIEFNPVVIKLMSLRQKTGILKRAFVIYSNCCQCLISLEQYNDAFKIGKGAIMYYERILKLNNASADIQNEMKELFEKLRLRMRKIKENLTLPISVRYSAQEFPGIRVGSILVSTDHIGAGIFSNSKVLITKRTPGAGYEGIIVNKSVSVQGMAVNVGGPCEISQKSVLHNIPNIAGSTEIVPGLFLNGDMSSHIGNQNFRIKEYYGYAAWFEGQLDGELSSNDWTLSNSTTIEEILPQAS